MSQTRRSFLNTVVGIFVATRLPFWARQPPNRVVSKIEAALPDIGPGESRVLDVMPFFNGEFARRHEDLKLALPTDRGLIRGPRLVGEPIIERGDGVVRTGFQCTEPMEIRKPFTCDKVFLLLDGRPIMCSGFTEPLEAKEGEVFSIDCPAMGQFRTKFDE